MGLEGKPKRELQLLGSPFDTSPKRRALGCSLPGESVFGEPPREKTPTNRLNSPQRGNLPYGPLVNKAYLDVRPG